MVVEVDKEEERGGREEEERRKEGVGHPKAL